ncbi:MAG: hypothetical protein CMG64_07725 [Candidatus Marinimicrobia bacterium]|nr:hypothetical protein [Candidatus Neomarinimicrobiota bacterium]|tara:strand:- start:261 stop:713 length:453 start_codon:yes stop_codon:yes gene_type:complete
MENLLIICAANYCRSPVAEKIFNHILEDGINCYSAGTLDFFETNMDKRSLEFLNLKGIPSDIHIPKKVTRGLVESSDLILAMDINVLLQISRLYPGQTDKLKLFSSIKNKIPIKDPYKEKEKEIYFEIMEEIYSICLLWTKKLNAERGSC